MQRFDNVVVVGSTFTLGLFSSSNSRLIKYKIMYRLQIYISRNGCQCVRNCCLPFLSNLKHFMYVQVNLKIQNKCFLLLRLSDISEWIVLNTFGYIWQSKFDSFDVRAHLTGRSYLETLISICDMCTKALLNMLEFVSSTGQWRTLGVCVCECAWAMVIRDGSTNINRKQLCTELHLTDTRTRFKYSNVMFTINYIPHAVIIL